MLQTVPPNKNCQFYFVAHFFILYSDTHVHTLRVSEFKSNISWFPKHCNAHKTIKLTNLEFIQVFCCGKDNCPNLNGLTPVVVLMVVVVVVDISEQIVSGSRGGEDGGRGGEDGGRGGGERVLVHCTSSSSSDTLITACVLCFLNEPKSFLWNSY